MSDDEGSFDQWQIAGRRAMELNPNHPVTQELHENWHKFVAIILHKFKLGKVSISVDDMRQMERDFP